MNKGRCKGSFVGNVVSINALWVWWKCVKYEGFEYNVVDMIKIFWNNLGHPVKGEYDSIKGNNGKGAQEKDEKA